MTHDAERPQTSPERIAAAVRQARLAAGLDQATLALVSNVGARTVWKIEQGQAAVRLDVLLRVLRALGLDLDVVTRR